MKDYFYFRVLGFVIAIFAAMWLALVLEEQIYFTIDLLLLLLAFFLGSLLTLWREI